MSHIRLAASALAAAVLGFASTATLAADATGVWQRPSGTSRIEISPCGSSLCGKLVWLKAPRNDSKNPDPAKRARPLLGTRTVMGMTPAGDAGVWKGKVYNAEDGKTYSGRMTLEGPDKLSLKGCVLGGLICRGETWSRVK
ncbi:DUF2147 domain-containing protein [Stappia sp. ES.058]|uniref:DUF2147 domain-containing protein n=1 Tax=Stappia sp. ES.058 TaxID=1881061 RepID=UPI00087D3499|nr:DUF2147 domain-containing protein [Stappia sp. ES.058]SDU19079.1 Uncharacterized conserved protein, DUF2147 family [Stappia sp. ES.058]